MSATSHRHGSIYSSLQELHGLVVPGTGDGILHILGPGDMMLAEDITGQGHTTRVIGNKDRISIAIPVE